MINKPLIKKVVNILKRAICLKYSTNERLNSMFGFAEMSTEASMLSS